ncbi:MAG: tRNA uridine-5-carboxymethylaminomethyl(34) synthesis GTPase MnmE [bacterium]|nr:tRNA uridine-5-carboxymethylaminomethyl(34) synthesis GTPase MnmE [bacterium]
MNDTIAGIATSKGVGAISIIRVSGEEAISITNKIFNKDLNKVNTHTIHYGYIKDNEKIIDEVLVTVMRKPKSYTTEDIVEINCHGSISTCESILQLLIKNGTRLAEPGEFTKRAFLNGRIDLVEAESIMSLISSTTNKARDISISQLSGTASANIKLLRQEILDIISLIEVNIDYPEYEDISVLTNEELLPQINNIIKKLDDILKISHTARIYTNGIKVGIVGKPNVGKSSLLNALLNEDKAIVTSIPGTTTDIVEGNIKINDLLLQITDTAGIRESTNKIEELGVEKSKQIIHSSELILLVLNNNEEFTKEDELLIESIKDKPHIIIINKIDLEQKLILPSIYKAIYISIENKQGLEELKQTINNMFNSDNIKTENPTYLTTSRTLGLIEKAKNLLLKSKHAIKEATPIDIVEIDIKEAWQVLGEITGEYYTTEMIDNIFANFCLGK